MKKQILFICSNMNIGGFQTSLLALLKCFDYSRYDVDLYLLNKDGIFTPQIPKEVNILDEPLPHEYFYSAKQAIFALLKLKKFGLAIHRALAAACSVINKGYCAVLMSKVMSGLPRHYDVAVDYNGQRILYYMVDKIDADRKISYFHSDYKMWPYYEKTDRKYYAAVDAIVTVSDECVASMKDVFPEYADKIYRVENIISPRTVGKGKVKPKALDGNFKIVTVARVCLGKGIDFVVQACKILTESGYSFKWYWVGPYDENDPNVKEISRLGLSSVLILTGTTDKPYEYMAACDIMVQPSRFEGKAVSVEEGKVMGLPVVAARYSTVQNQIEDGKSGIIVDMTPEALAKGIGYMIDNPEKRAEMAKYLNENCLGNEYEAEVLYSLIDG